MYKFTQKVLLNISSFEQIKHFLFFFLIYVNYVQHLLTYTDIQ